MAMRPPNARSDSAQPIPDSEVKVRMAFEVWSAFQRAEADCLSLKKNPYWIAIREEVWADFAEAFEAAR